MYLIRGTFESGVSYMLGSDRSLEAAVERAKRLCLQFQRKRSSSPIELPSNVVVNEARVKLEPGRRAILVKKKELWSSAELQSMEPENDEERGK